MDELTTAMDVETNSKFEERLDELAARQKTTGGEVIQLHYDIGVLAKEMIDAAPKIGKSSTYGEEVMKRVADRLHRRDREVYACIQLAGRLSQAEIDEFKQANRPWPLRGVTALLTAAGPGALQAFKKRYEDGKFANTDELREAIVAHNQGHRASTKKAKAAKPTHTGGQARAQILRLNTDLTHMIKEGVPEAMKGFRDYTKYHDSYSSKTTDDVEKAMREVKKRIDSLGTYLG